jgi:hypothetical protein
MAEKAKAYKASVSSLTYLDIEVVSRMKDWREFMYNL